MTIQGKEGTEVVELWFRDGMEAVRQLISNPRFREVLRYAPEENFTAEDRGTRVFSEMWTGLWWARIQVCTCLTVLIDMLTSNQNLLAKGATVVPFILSTDTTQLVHFGKRKAYPVYLTIGNISKSVRSRPSERAWLLIGYIPVPELNWITDVEDKREAKWELYHTCMTHLVAPLRQVANVGVEVVCADGGVRCIHPILAAHVADFPEQLTIASTIRTGCPICLVPPDKRGDYDDDGHFLRTKNDSITAYKYADQGYTLTLTELGLWPVRPFWLDYPFATPGLFIVPDLLHQIHKGVFMHLVTWCRTGLGDAELDRRYKGVPPLSGLRHFNDGISVLKMETGDEARAMERSFVPLLAGSQPADMVGASRCIVDFLYRAHRPQLSETDLAALEADLKEFHDYKEIFRSAEMLTTRDGFKGIPKFHMLQHYAESIRQLGTTDGYNTEAPERLHIDYVKVAYRASKGPDQVPQMSRHLQRREALSIVRARLERHGIIPKRQTHWRRDGTREGVSTQSVKGEDSDVEDDELEDAESVGAGDDEDVLDGRDVGTLLQAIRRLVIAKSATHAGIRGSTLIAEYHATDLIKELTNFFRRHCPSSAASLDFDEHVKFDVWTRCRLVHDPLPFAPLVGPKIDRVRAYPGPATGSRRSTHKPAFDTVLLDVFPDRSGLDRKRLSSNFGLKALRLTGLLLFTRLSRCTSAGNFQTSSLSATCILWASGLR